MWTDAPTDGRDVEVATSGVARGVEPLLELVRDWIEERSG